jgi:hypothetical protein
MDYKAISKSRARLKLAQQQIDQAGKASSHDEFAGSWYLFLIAAKNVYTSLEQGAKVSAQSRQWFGAKKNERKTDPLLQYLFQARDDDEHGLGDVTKFQPGSLAIGKASPGFSSNMSISMSTDALGRPTIHELRSHDGLPILIEETRPHSILLPVTGRGNVTFHPPKEHLGQKLTDSLPLTVGRLGLSYLATLIDEAEGRVA